MDSSASLTVFLSFATLECVPMFYIRLKAWDCSGKGQVGRLEWEEGSRPGGGQTGQILVLTLGEGDCSTDLLSIDLQSYSSLIIAFSEWCAKIKLFYLNSLEIFC